jgi:flagellar motor switch protein FliM
LPSLEIVTAQRPAKETLPPPVARLIDPAHAVFAQGLSTNLSALLRTSVSAEPGRLESLLFDVWRNRTARPTCIVSLKTRPGSRPVILLLAPSVILPALELLLGAKSDPAEAAARPLTDLEWNLLEEIVRVIARELGEAWQPFGTMEFELHTLNSDPSLVEDFERTDAVLSIPFELAVGSHRGSLEVVVPASFFAVPAEAPRAAAVNPANQARILELIADAPVDVEIVLHGQDASLRDLADLEPGQVLTFERALDTPLIGIVNGEPTLRGQISAAGKKRGFLVERP